MKMSKCKTQLSVKVEVCPSPDEQLQLTIFDPTLQLIIDQNVYDLSEEELCVKLLYFEGVEITYNANTSVVTDLKV